MNKINHDSNFTPRISTRASKLSLLALALATLVATGCATELDLDEPEAVDAGTTWEEPLLAPDCKMTFSWSSLSTNFLWGVRSVVTCTQTHSSFTMKSTLKVNGGSSTSTRTCGTGKTCSIQMATYDVSGLQLYTVTTTATVDGRSTTQSSSSTR